MHGSSAWEAACNGKGRPSTFATLACNGIRGPSAFATLSAMLSEFSLTKFITKPVSDHAPSCYITQPYTFLGRVQLRVSGYVESHVAWWLNAGAASGHRSIFTSPPEGRRRSRAPHIDMLRCSWDSARTDGIRKWYLLVIPGLPQGTWAYRLLYLVTLAVTADRSEKEKIC